jgi:hypothetical protein
MKRILTIAVSFLMGPTIFFISCQKELSCVDCTDANKPPIALAGNDIFTTLPTDSIRLDGSSSSDPDGAISEFLWTKISGPPSYIIANNYSATTTVKNLVAGIYQFELKVTDAGGLSAKDTVQVNVSNPSQPNRPPVANAGVDQTITLPTNIVNFDGSGSTDPDNNITSYIWTKISGPFAYNFSNANGMQTTVTGLVAGVYIFELKVTDASGLFAKDTLQVSVMSAPTACLYCRIVFVSDRDGNEEIYSCLSDGSGIRRLTNDVAKDREPAWSPDGTRVAFTSDRTGHSELYIMNADGSNVVRKTFSGVYCQNPTWSPDGTKIAYSGFSNGSMNIWVVNATGGSPSLLFEAPGYDDYPKWSPDGTRIALVSDWAAYDFVYDIYTINSDGTGGFTPLTGNIFDHVDYLHPSWSPNGTKLALSISKTIGIDQYDTQVAVMTPGGSGLTVIRSGAAAWSKTSWSGDGTRIVYTSLGKDISWVSADGSAGGIIVSGGWDADWQH